jgi:hypothetical protein
MLLKIKGGCPFWRTTAFLSGYGYYPNLDRSSTMAIIVVKQIAKIEKQ